MKDLSRLAAVAGTVAVGIVIFTVMDQAVKEIVFASFALSAFAVARSYGKQSKKR
jgi:hypothetical protein